MTFQILTQADIASVTQNEINSFMSGQPGEISYLKKLLAWIGDLSDS